MFLYSTVGLLNTFQTFHVENYVSLCNTRLKEEQNRELAFLNYQTVDHTVIGSPLKDTDSIDDSLILFAGQTSAVSAEVSAKSESTFMSFNISSMLQF